MSDCTCIIVYLTVDTVLAFYVFLALCVTLCQLMHKETSHKRLVQDLCYGVVFFKLVLHST